MDSVVDPASGAAAAKAAEAAAGKVALEASQRLGDELQRTRRRRDRRRAAARIITSELERVDWTLHRALNRDVWKLDPASLDVPAWDRYRDTLAELLDDTTWEVVERAISSGGPMIEGVAPDDPTAPTERDTTWRRIAVWHLREFNALARMKLVKYATRPSGLKRLWTSRAEYWMRREHDIFTSVEMPPDLRELAERSEDRPTDEPQHS
jgi:hypothetical protein